VAIATKVGTAAPTIQYAYTDYLGSILTVTNSTGAVITEQNFDAWGRMRNPSTWAYTSVPTSPTWLYRGYTGHEHVPQFGLINMNGRMYDPVVGRMLSVDNFVQEVRNSQSYNRYSYVVNNPLKYNDPSGEFFRPWLNFTIGFYSGLIKGDGIAESVRSGWHRASNGVRITAGAFVTDGNKPWRRPLELLSRFTWQLPQTTIGYSNAHIYNTFGLGGGVEAVDYEYGATVISTRGNWGGVTMSNVILGDRTIAADANNTLFQHEYGHYLQSQASGGAYLWRYGLPSLLTDANSHDFSRPEQDANRRAFLYFNREVAGFQNDANQEDGSGWNFSRNPLDINRNGRLDTPDYVDFTNGDRSVLRSLRPDARWFFGW
jgi:RHS repeat-associated protein